MKKVKVLERFSILFVLMLVFLTSYCLVYGYEPISQQIIPSLCTQEPKMITPNFDGAIPVLNEFYFEINAPCALGAHLILSNITGPQPTMVIPDGYAGTDSIIRFPKLPVTSFSNGRYALIIEIYYPTGTGIPSRFIGSTSNPKYFFINSGIPVVINPPTNPTAPTTPITQNPTTPTTNPINTTITAPTSNTSTNTGQVPATDPSSTTVPSATVVDTVSADIASQQITINGKTLTESERQTYIQNLLQNNETKDLDPELEAAQTSTLINTKSADIISQGDSTSRVIFRGKAEPNTTIWLYIYSEPIVVAVQTDANGDWSYTLDQDIAAGKHEVYVAVKDTGGKITAKSQPFSFFIGTAEAAAAADTTVKNSTPAEKNYLIYYITLAVSIVAIMIAAVFFLVTKSHIKKNVANAKA
jgi:hypothetical protein